MRSLKWSTCEVVISATGQVMVDPFCIGKTTVWCERRRRFLFCKILSSSWTWGMWSASKSASSCKCIQLVNSHRPYTSMNKTVLISRCSFYLPFWFHSHLSCFSTVCVGLCWFDFSLPASVFPFVIFIFLAFALVKLHSIRDIPGCLHIVALSGSSLYSPLPLYSLWVVLNVCSSISHYFKCQAELMLYRTFSFWYLLC